MGKAFLIMSTAILLSVNSNCQWYIRRYGVNDINQLSQEQLNEALRKAKIGVWTGAILSIESLVGIGNGIIIILNNLNKSNSQAIYGIGYLTVSIPLEIAGMALMRKNNQRIKSIKEVLRKTELKMGLVNYQRGDICSGIPRLIITLFISNDSLLRKINKSIMQQAKPSESASIAYLLFTLNAFL